MKVLSLFSGGLDSSLAAKIIQKQGIDVEGICFISPFFNAKKAEIAAAAKIACAYLGIQKQITVDRDISDAEILKYQDELTNF